MLAFLLQKSDEVAEQAAEDVAAAAADMAAAAERAAQAAEELEQASREATLLIDPVAALAETAQINEFVYLFTIFLLAIFVGYYVVWSVTPALHTPLMSVTNAISSVVIVGALIAVGAEVAQSAAGVWSRWLGVGAVALASVNIFGGFLVTQRMLAMYKKKES